jgi:hypothetical protein
MTLLVGSSLVKAHGHITQWTVNGETKEGFDPNSPGGYSGAQRPTDNSEANGYGWGKSNFQGRRSPADSPGPANYDTSLGRATNEFTASGASMSWKACL